jgi:hypothetical protein
MSINPLIAGDDKDSDNNKFEEYEDKALTVAKADMSLVTRQGRGCDRATITILLCWENSGCYRATRTMLSCWENKETARETLVITFDMQCSYSLSWIERRRKHVIDRCFVKALFQARRRKQGP